MSTISPALVAIVFLMGIGCGSAGMAAPPEPVPVVVEASVEELVIGEGGDGSFTVRLSDRPSADVVIRVEVAVGSSAFTVLSGSTLRFTPATWAAAQSVTLRAPKDSNQLNDYGSVELHPDAPLPPIVVGLTQEDVEGMAADAQRIATVKDASGDGAAQWPVTAVFPVEYGVFQSVDMMRLVDAAGTPVPAQIEVLNRWWARDNSVRHVVAHFEATVAGGGSARYNLRTDGAGPSPARPVTVTESGGVATVDTGVLRFRVKRDGFNLFDEVFLDTNGDGQYAPDERIVAPDTLNGSVFTGRIATDIQRAAERGDLRLVVEKRGPMVAVLRISGLTLYNGADDHRHGFAVRIFAYAGKPFVKVDYQLQNSAKNQVFAAPLYFEDLSLELRPALTSPTLRIATGPGQVWSGPVGGGRGLFQGSLTSSSVRSLADDSVLLAGANAPALPSFGWADLSDPNRGVFVAIRNMAEMWPNGIDVLADRTLAVRLWPKRGEQLYEEQHSPTGLYWLEDLQHVLKETLFWFHGPGVPAGDLDRMARTFQRRPIPFVSISEFGRTKATMTMGGIVPATALIGPHRYQGADGSKLIVDRFEYVFDARTDETSYEYNFGWQNFFGDIGRKIAKTAGGLPQSSWRPFATGRVDEWITAEAAVLGELNCRPQWIAEYERDRDLALILPTVDPYGGSSWRRYMSTADGGMPLDSPHIPGTGFGGWTPRDNEHGWFYHLDDWYYVTADPWLRDWFEWMKEFRKGERSLPGLADWSSLSDTGWEVPRAEAHSIANGLQAFRVTGDPTILEWLRKRLDNLDASRDRNTGTFLARPAPENPTVVSLYEHGYMAHALIQVLDEIEGYDPELYHRVFAYVWGIVDFNYHLGSFTYHFDLAQQKSINLIGFPDTFPAPSSFPGITLADPQAWFGLTTGIGKYIDQTNQFIDSGLNGAEPPYRGDFDLQDLRLWSGAYDIGRVTQYVREHPPVANPPAAISDLAASALMGDRIRLSWTTPARAASFHVYWSTKPFSATYTQSTTESNPWGGTPVWRDLPAAAPGTVQTLDVTGAPSGQTVHVIVYTRTAEGHLSAMSNVVQVTAP